MVLILLRGKNHPLKKKMASSIDSNCILYKQYLTLDQNLLDTLVEKTKLGGLHLLENRKSEKRNYDVG